MRSFLTEPFLRRPLFGMAAGMVAGLMLGMIGIRWYILLAVMGTGMMIVLCHKRWRQKLRKSPGIYLFLPAIMLLWLPIGSAVWRYGSEVSELTSLLYENHQEMACRVTGTVCRVKKTSSRVQYELKDVIAVYQNEEGIPVQEAQSHVMLYPPSGDNPVCQIGDRIEAVGDVSGFSSATNPGEFDAREYYRTLRITLRIAAKRIQRIDGTHNLLLRFANTCRVKLKQVYEEITDEKTASVYEAIVLGNRDELDEELSDLFSVSGIGHILAISGLHISLLGMGLYRMLRRAGMRTIPAMIAGTTIILFYGYLTGNGISTVRALIMFAVAVFSQVIGRTYDILSGASLAAILMLWYSPHYLTNCGFLLSYGAVLGIALVGETTQKLFAATGRFSQALIGSAAIQVITVPITAYFYFRIPMLATGLNLIVIPLMTIVMISGITGGLGGLLAHGLGVFCIGPGYFIIRFYEWLCEITAKIPHSIMTIGRPKPWMLWLYYLVIIIFLYLADYRRNKKSVFLLVFAFLILWFPKVNGFAATYLDVGQGDGIYIHTPNGMNILIDGGSSSKEQPGKRIIEPYLLAMGQDTIAYGIVTHADSDHINGLRELLYSDVIRLETMIVPSAAASEEAMQKLIATAVKKGTQVVQIKAGDRIDIGEVAIRCLHPSADYDIKDRNCGSAALLVTYRNFSMLCCGDLCSEEEQMLLEDLHRDAPITVVKSNHHGSQYSNCEDFFLAAQPEYVVISCGRNNLYGHPHPDALTRMQSSGAQIFRTDTGGAVTIRTNGKIWSVYSFINDT